MRNGFILLLWLLAAAPRASGEETEGDNPLLKEKVEPIVLLIGLDGLRWDILDRFELPNLARLAAAGIRARALLSQFPSFSYVNLYTIVTGLYPENHGIVNNFMFDPEMGETFNFYSSVKDSRWWGGEPIWNTVEKEGKVAATYFWVGADMAIGGVRPNYNVHYDPSLPEPERIAQVLAWLDLPAGKRPSFIALYFDEVDKALHRFGVNSGEEKSAVEKIDRNLGHLLDGLRTRKLLKAVNIIIVSDHGFVNLNPSKIIFLDDYIELAALRILEFEYYPAWPMISIFPAAGHAKEVLEKLKKIAPGMTVYAKKEIPDRFHNRDNRRVPPIICVADEGGLIASRALWEKNQLTPLPVAMHGYDPELESMHGFFTASGPAFPRGVVVNAFSNVHIYSLIAEILGLSPAPNDGDPEFAKSLLRAEASVMK